jgi:hypothetical protein
LRVYYGLDLLLSKVSKAQVAESSVRHNFAMTLQVIGSFFSALATRDRVNNRANNFFLQNLNM